MRWKLEPETAQEKVLLEGAANVKVQVTDSKNRVTIWSKDVPALRRSANFALVGER